MQNLTSVQPLLDSYPPRKLTSRFTSFTVFHSPKPNRTRDLLSPAGQFLHRPLFLRVPMCKRQSSQPVRGKVDTSTWCTMPGADTSAVWHMRLEYSPTISTTSALAGSPSPQPSPMSI